MLKNSIKISNDSIYISPSIIASDLTRMGEIVQDMKKECIDLVHIDIMDGHFVPNLTFGPAYTKSLQNHTDIPLDIHLMIERPEDTIDQYIDMDPWCITIHYESTPFPARLLKVIRDAGIVAGLAINPATPVESVYDMLPYTDMVLIMSVDPGFYGQKFMENSLKRIEKLSKFSQSEGYKDLLIQVDGGINNGNISSAVQAGAGIFVAGGSAFKDGNVNENVMQLKKSAGK